MRTETLQLRSSHHKAEDVRGVGGHTVKKVLRTRTWYEPGRYEPEQDIKKIYFLDGDEENRPGFLASALLNLFLYDVLPPASKPQEELHSHQRLAAYLANWLLFKK